ncbi:mannitol-1-phosphate/altronate dehydrogenase [Spongiibacter sp. IMCC21906]|uniref:mannitol dehydrogenase family protein n=1 Tax=Spongiibacter sp. IMCC21906 TaxID=1620392 RepID=UPI00062DF5D3|nr:mannitol dehydrogenase family protein [Spongiibacter sp. IMCC21906]AKH69282.1 mannitol-1-phosphate/altronate dehydrogenase [Spongiibacter sp. IMCC21906]
MRLNQNSRLANAIKQANYQREQHRAGIVHLGLGAFHRAHQAWYTEQVLNQFGGDWRIIGVSLRSPTVHDQLAPQDYLYTLIISEGVHRHQQLIGALAKVLIAPQQPEQVISALAAAATQVVTLTITEKGYCLRPDGKQLDEQHSEVQHDLKNVAQPRTALGFLAAGLAARRDQHKPGLTIISCDNISGNGEKLRSALLQFCRRIDPTLADWIDSHCRFPATMVDRIVPATTPENIQDLATDLGYQDQAAVFSEPFCQWVIEENFAGPMPPWDKVGAQYVTDVTPFEAMKLRLLNASHSAIAYLGCLAGYNTVDRVIANPVLRKAIEQLMTEEAAPTLSMPIDFDLQAYQQSLLQRFANSALQHRCQQIAIDGSQKIPNRLFPILRWQRQHKGPIVITTAALAAWLRYLQGIDETGNRYPINDPMATQLDAIFAQHNNSAKNALPALRESNGLFPKDIAAQDEVFIAIENWLTAFEQQGIVQAIELYQNHDKQ